MGTVRIDDRLWSHPALDHLHGDAFALYICALSYSAERSTNGYLSQDDVERLAAFRFIPLTVVKELTATGGHSFVSPWVVVDGGYQITQAIRWQIVKDMKEPATRRRFRKLRKRLFPIVFDRDDFRCRRCGGSERLTIDHIHPIAKGGGNELDNLQTLCIWCNSRKRDRIETIHALG